MKKLTILFFALLPILACNNQNGEGEQNENDQTEDTTAVHTPDEQELPATGHFGAEITPDGAIDAGQLASKLDGKDSVRAKVKGTVGEVCQMKGCWMTMPVGDDDMQITFKDYGFFVPKESSGKEAIMEGVAKKRTVPVEELKHYAEDAGKSEAEIASITEPEERLVFVAEGVILR